MNSIHNPHIEVPLRSGKIEVKELSWPDAMELYNRLKTLTSGFIDAKGLWLFDVNKIVNAIQESVEVSEWLVLKTTGKDKDWLAGLTVGEFLDVAGEAAVLNVSVIVEKIKKVQSRLRTVTAGENLPPNTTSGSSTAASPTPRSS